MRCTCPNCAEVVEQDREAQGLNYCTSCRTLFYVPTTEPVPTWILGVLTFLLAKLQSLWH